MKNCPKKKAHTPTQNKKLYQKKKIINFTIRTRLSVQLEVIQRNVSLVPIADARSGWDLVTQTQVWASEKRACSERFSTHLTYASKLEPRTWHGWQWEDSHVKGMWRWLSRLAATTLYFAHEGSSMAFWCTSYKSTEVLHLSHTAPDLNVANGKLSLRPSIWQMEHYHCDPQSGKRNTTAPDLNVANGTLSFWPSMWRKEHYCSWLKCGKWNTIIVTSLWAPT